MLRNLSERYVGPADLPQRLPVFPLQGAILLPLNIFEPRYLQMLEDVMSTARVLCIVQPDAAEEESPAGKTVPLRRVGCVGRVTSYQETEDGRLLITLTGIARCSLVEEVEIAKPYRICTVRYERFLRDFEVGAGDETVRLAGDDHQSLRRIALELGELVLEPVDQARGERVDPLAWIVEGEPGDAPDAGDAGDTLGGC
mgnify:CR=1 FL=1